MDAGDRRRLQNAVERLERQSFAMTLANRAGMPVEALMRRLPAGTQVVIGRAVNKALEQCLRVALKSVEQQGHRAPGNLRHMLMTAATGATGGFFGIAGLAVELPVTTTLMLHSIAEIAKSHGEDLREPEAALSCLQVLALGRDRGRPDAVESAYYATRAALAQTTRQAAAYLTEKGLSERGAPAILQFLSRIAARFGIEVTEKAAAQLVPIAGAVGGMTLNVVFTNHFQSLAEGHFTVRELERRYGTAEVEREYAQMGAVLASRHS